ncbi:GGDEF domain-containing protein [Deinococcus roseus]|nr:GGDEF domain-containing protein [Deinococcus roseus]
MSTQQSLLTRLKHHNYSFLLPAAILLTVHHLFYIKDPAEQLVVTLALGMMLLSLGLYLKNREAYLGVLDWISTWGQLGMVAITLNFVWLSPQVKPDSGLYLLPAWGIVMVWHWTVVYNARPLLSLLISFAYFLGTVTLFWILNQHGFQNLKALDVAIQGAMAIIICRAIHNVYGQMQEESRKRRDAEKLAVIDPLTRLPNRRAFQQELEQAVEHQHSTHLVVFDIDHFKRINDRQGHDVGDLILQKIAELAQQAFQQGRTFRWGGEEFCVILEDISPEDTSRLCEKFRTSVEGHEFINELRITVSLGVTRVQPWDNAESAFRRADGALLNVKGNGRNHTRMV